MRSMKAMALAAVITTSTTAFAGTSFTTSTNDLGGNAYQLVNTFDILYSGANAYLDFDLDNNPDSVVPVGAPDTLASYLDPEHYVLDFGTDLQPFFLGMELTAADSVDWRLSYVGTPGSTVLYSTIMSGTSTDNGDGTWTLDINLGLEWPVAGFPENDLGVPEGTHVAAAIADFSSFTWDGETLSANVIPVPAAWAALAMTGLIGTGRRRR
ncbi:MAG: hypothetical protein CMJ39_11340 [Phycisphaerae bacterium]|nr:hypothetical protein [Phycisphaerae bacterium]